jgi:hypothetical protein
MKLIVSTLLLFFGLMGQMIGQSIERQVISCMGHSFVNANVQVDFTLGETAIQTFSMNGIVVTQGFHQPLPSVFCLGDFDFNGIINVADLLIFVSNYGCQVNCGDPDLDGNGSVNVGDLLLFIGVYGSTCP